FTGRESNPLDRYKRFQIAVSSSFSGFILAQGKFHFVLHYCNSHNDLHCLPALNGATGALGNFPQCLTTRPALTAGALHPHHTPRVRLACGPLAKSAPAGVASRGQSRRCVPCRPTANDESVAPSHMSAARTRRRSPVTKLSASTAASGWSR